ELLHSLEHCRFPPSARGQNRRWYNVHDVLEVATAVRTAIDGLRREIRVAIAERHGRIDRATPLLRPLHWVQALAQRLAPEYEAWEADPDHRPAHHSLSRRRTWRAQVAERSLYREIPGRVWDDVREPDEGGRVFARERFHIGAATIRRLIPRKQRPIP